METKYTEIYKRIWELSPRYKDSVAYDELNSLTKELIHIYDLQGRLTDDPFNSTRERKLSQPNERIAALLKGSVCLVTGGLGCVGSHLANELLKFDVDRIIILDKNKNSFYTLKSDPSIHIVYGDIRDA